MKSTASPGQAWTGLDWTAWLAPVVKDTDRDSAASDIQEHKTEPAKPSSFRSNYEATSLKKLINNKCLFLKHEPVNIFFFTIYYILSMP